jgi:hypothetical protein
MKNKTIKTLTALACSIALYIPSTTSIDTEADTSATLARVQTDLSNRFGGTTTTTGIGTWMSPTAGLVKEEVSIVRARTDETTLAANTDAMVELAESIKAELSQDAVALEINGTLYLV